MGDPLKTNLILDSNNIASISYYKAKSMSHMRGNLSEDDAGRQRLANFATYLYFQMIHSYIKQFEPSKMYVVWDGHSGSNWRKAAYPEYKAGRDHSGDNFYRQFQGSCEQEKLILSSYPIYQLYVEDAEADDLIYSVCKILSAGSENAQIVVSGDGDMLQLPQHFANTKIWNPRNKQFQEAPAYDVVTYKSITGDGSDRITGLPGFGPKKGLKLMEDLKNGSAKITDEQKAIIAKFRNLVDLSANPFEQKNRNSIIEMLDNSKITLDQNRIQQFFVKFELNSFMKKWAHIRKLLTQLEMEAANGGATESKSDQLRC
jgi:5'-3' exonuclease